MKFFFFLSRKNNSNIKTKQETSKNIPLNPFASIVPIAGRQGRSSSFSPSIKEKQNQITQARIFNNAFLPI